MNKKDFLQDESNKELCRFITCGSVDDGKSSLIGRLLYDTKSIFSDQMDDFIKDSKKFGTQAGKLDFALLVDGLLSERQQGITIDVAYRFFSSKKRKFIIADTPGHEQYTRNMATGASLANIAIVLVDATKGVLTQTKRHSYIASLFGIKNIIVVVNKMDLVSYSESVFNNICRDYKNILDILQSSINIHFIPICALSGENIVQRSKNLSWYKNDTLLELLENIPILKHNNNEFILPIQFVHRPNSNFRSFCGNIASGDVKIGDEVIVLPSMKKSKIKYIDIANDIKLDSKEDNKILIASEGMAVSVCLEDEIDIQRGDIFASLSNNLNITKNIKAFVIWMNEEKLCIDKKYLIKINHNIVEASVTKILFKKDINTFDELKAECIYLNDIAYCNIEFDRNVVADKYNNNRIIGSFLIIDKYNNETLGAGLIDEFLISNNETKRIYSQAEKELNVFIRKNFPEWECKEI